MKTQCPHCNAKFTAPDGSVGKKVKCPRCGQLFVIAILAEIPRMETCTKCGRPIGQSEQACVFNGGIVCQECDESLRKGTVTNEMTGASQIVNSVRKSRFLPFRKASKVGLVLSIIILFFTVRNIVEGPRKETKLEFTEDKVLTVQYTHHHEYWSINIVGIVFSVCLCVRSFLPGLGFWRGVLTYVGVAVILMIPLNFIFIGIPLGFGLFSMNIGFMALGGIMLYYGFKQKKS